MKIQKKNIFFFFFGGGGRWEGSGWGGVRVDVNEIEVFVKIQKILGGGSVGGGGRGRVGGSEWM